MELKFVIVDYGMGNLHSIKKKLVRLGLSPLISSKAIDIANADKLILPGVGHFGKAMSNLKELNLVEPLNEYILVNKKPILGICLGMQLMTKYSEEGNEQGLGWIDAEVVKFKIKDKFKYKIPHMGWNQVSIKKTSKLMLNIPENSEFYFVHSYHIKANNNNDILNSTDYGYNFVSAIEKENIYGVQYHPEKSHDAGEQLLKNFMNL